ncbi:MAG: hypothetical protein IJX93_11140 [Clostridia bacterium]|nr:hypothetical protein [Clostridia bacterium]
MKSFKLQIAAPDGLRYDGDACQLSVRGIAGELAVLAGHVPFVTAVKDCECRVYTDDGKTIRRAHTTGGMLLVSKECVRLLSSGFTWADA